MFNKNKSNMPEAPSQEGASLEAPSHENVEGPKPIIESLNVDPSNDLKMPLAPKGGIEVVATRKGFYNQTRVKEGTKFIIRSMDRVGTWMECIDPALEVKRKEYLNIKAKA